MLKIVIRADASINIGFGHVMRCITLANQLKEQGADISFICRGFPGHLKSFIKKYGFTVNLLPAPKIEYIRQDNDPEHALWLRVPWQQDADELKEILGNEIIDWLIVDHYGIDYRWHKSIRDHTKHIMVIDDLADRKHDCDLLIDQTYKREKSAYISLVPKYSQLLLGSEYALLRPEFSKLRHKAINKRKNITSIKRILVSLGSMDPHNFTAQILLGLSKVEWEEKPVIDVVLGKRAPYLKSIIDLSKRKSLDLNINVLEDIENMSELMLEADLAIGAGGSTSWERCYLGLPSLLVKLAENQKQVILELIKAGAARSISNVDIEKSVIVECNDLQKNFNAMYELSTNSFKVVNGQGTQLIVIKMNTYLAKDSAHVTLRNAKMSDAKVIYKWQSDPNTRRYFHNLDVPKFDEHINWLKKKLMEPTSFFYVIEHKNRAAGILRLDYKDNFKKNVYLVSIYIAPDYYQQSLGSIALNYANYLFKKSELHAEINEDNIASRKLFRRSGYVKSTEKTLYIRYVEKNGIVH